MFFQFPSALDAWLDAGPSDQPIEPASPGVLTLAPAARQRRRSEPSVGVLSASRCAAAGWMLQVTSPPSTNTWTAPALPPPVV